MACISYYIWNNHVRRVYI